MTSEKELLDRALVSELGEKERKRLWLAAERILSYRKSNSSALGLALGYVQSGKTTQMIALTAAAYDAGYRVVVALLGSTNLLLDQKQK